MEGARRSSIVRHRNFGRKLVLSGLAPLFAILGALLVGAISPGPSFVFVVRTSVARSRIDGIAAAVGMGVGAMSFGALALVGLRTLMTEAAGLYWALKIAGGIYLVYLGIRIWLGASAPLQAVGNTEIVRPAPLRSFALGLATQFSNPKIVAVFGAIFAALLPADYPHWMAFVLPPLIFFQETAWYTIVAVAFSSARPRALYLRARKIIDRTAGVVIGLLGIRLLLEAR